MPLLCIYLFLPHFLRSSFVICREHTPLISLTYFLPVCNDEHHSPFGRVVANSHFSSILGQCSNNFSYLYFSSSVFPVYELLKFHFYISERSSTIIPDLQGALVFTLAIIPSPGIVILLDIISIGLDMASRSGLRQPALLSSSAIN